VGLKEQYSESPDIVTWHFYVNFAFQVLPATTPLPRIMVSGVGPRCRRSSALVGLVARQPAGFSLARTNLNFKRRRERVACRSLIVKRELYLTLNLKFLFH
jgi:hypothetical protein